MPPGNGFTCRSPDPVNSPDSITQPHARACSQSGRLYIASREFLVDPIASRTQGSLA